MEDVHAENARGPRTTPETTLIENLGFIERLAATVCRRSHLGPADTQDFTSHVKLKLVDQDYAILRKFGGRSTLHTFLAVVIQRLFLDYRNSLWGKWRPSAEARRAGPMAVLLERLMIRDEYSFDEACELLVTKNVGRVSRVELEQLSSRLPLRMSRRFESDESLATVASPQPPIEETILVRERHADATRGMESLRSLMNGLGAQDRIILAMRFEDGRTVAEIALALRLDQKALYRRIDRLLKWLRQNLRNQGFEDVMRGLIDEGVESEVEVGLGKSRLGPSNLEEA